MIKKTLPDLMRKQHVLILCVALLLVLIVGGLLRARCNTWGPVESAESSKNNQIPSTSWRYVPGAQVKGEIVQFEPVDRKIVKQDGSSGQADPAVNVGASLICKNNFATTAELHGIAKTPTHLRLYALPPGIYDEWRQETASLDLAISQQRLTIRQWNGSGAEPVVTQEYQAAIGVTAQLSMAHEGGTLFVAVNGKRVAQLSEQNLLAHNQLWLGLQTEQPIALNRFTTRGCTVTTHEPGAIGRPPNGLAGLALQHRSNMRIGAAVSLYPIVSDDQYRHLALSQFSMLTPENEMKAQFIHPAPRQYTFGPADLLVATAEANNMAVHGHALVFGEANPAWMQQTSPANRPQIMNDHIATVLGHYRGRVAEWDVVNEPLSDRDEDYEGDGDGLRRHIWYLSMGEAYIANAFRAAHQADPVAKLYLNDYGLEEDGPRWEALLGLLDRLQAARVPIDGVGFETHIHEMGDAIEQAVLLRHFAELQKRGLVVRISEIDVDGQDVKWQSQQYGIVMQACFAAANCTAYSTWGVSDAHGSTTEKDSYPLLLGNDLLWDERYQPKQAFYDLRQIIQRN